MLRFVQWLGYRFQRAQDRYRKRRDDGQAGPVRKSAQLGGKRPWRP
jgi:hypothetical protein